MFIFLKMSPSPKKILIICLLILLCYILLSSSPGTSLQIQENGMSLPTAIVPTSLPGKSPEGLPVSVAKPPNIIISPSIMSESENSEKGLMLNGADVAVIPADPSTNNASFSIKLFSQQESVLLALSSEDEQNYIVVCQAHAMVCVKTCLSVTQNSPNVAQVFTHEFANTLGKDWKTVSLVFTEKMLTVSIGKDTFHRPREQTDVGMPDKCVFHKLTLGGLTDQDDNMSMCRFDKLNFFGTEFGTFHGTIPARFPLNRRQHLTVYPIDISFTLSPETDGTLLVIYENDSNYFKLFLENDRLKTVLKSKGRKHAHLFNYKFEATPVSVKIIIDEYIAATFVKGLVAHSSVISERSPVVGLKSSDIYWLSSAARIFIGGVPLFPDENYKGILTDVTFRDVTSLF